MPEQRLLVPVPAHERKISALMFGILAVVLVIIVRQYLQGGLSSFAMAIFALIWLITAYKHLCRMLWPMIVLESGQLKLQKGIGFARIATSDIEAIRQVPHQQGWLNPPYGYFVIHSTASSRPHRLVPRSEQNKNALMQFFSEYFPEQWQPIDPLVDSLRS